MGTAATLLPSEVSQTVCTSHPPLHVFPNCPGRTIPILFFHAHSLSLVVPFALYVDRPGVAASAAHGRPMADDTVVRNPAHEHLDGQSSSPALLLVAVPAQQ